jgi:hypothetical protein
MNIKIILSVWVLFNLYPYTTDAQEQRYYLPVDSMLILDMYELENRLLSNQHDTIPLSIIFKRLNSGKGVSSKTLHRALYRRVLHKDSIRAFYDAYVQIKTVEKDLTIPVLTMLLPDLRQTKDTVLQKKVMLKMYEVRRHVYRQYLDLQYLNYETAEYLYKQKDYETADEFLWDIFDMEYRDMNVGDESDESYKKILDAPELSIPLYYLQEKAYLRLAEEMIRREKKTNIAILLKHPDYHIIRRDPNVRRQLNQYLKAAGMEPLKEEE